MFQNEILEKEYLENFIRELREEEKAQATIEKYRRDINAFLRFIGGKELTRESCNAYKEHLCEVYKPTSINSMISAINRFLEFLEAPHLRLRKLKVQRAIFCSQDRELTKGEYERLVQAANRDGDDRLALILETICSTGIRVSELKHITVESLHRRNTEIRSKGKIRDVLISDRLSKKLQQYCKAHRIRSGSVFVTRNGNPVHRSNIWKSMKSLCKIAGVSDCKVFPHNLRHLFARTYYAMEKDLNRLADILGHSCIETTRIYTMVSIKNQRKKIERLGLVLGDMT